MLHLIPHNLFIGILRHHDELENLVYVRFDFNQLLGGLWLVCILGSLLVNKLSDIGDGLDDICKYGIAHEDSITLGGLHFKGVLFGDD